MDSTLQALRGDTSGRRTASAQATWLVVLRRFVVFIAGANLVWEIAQLPLYTIWYEGTPGEIAFAVAHCTGGDILIAGASLLLALLIGARATWPQETYRRVAALTVAFAVPYTAFSEWLNTEVRGSWALLGADAGRPGARCRPVAARAVDHHPHRRLLVGAPAGSEGKSMRVTQ